MILYQFFDSMSPSQIDDFNLNVSNNHDLTCIGQFLTAAVIQKPTDEVSRHNSIVETRKRIDVVINAIKTYEIENKENPTHSVEDN